MKNLIILTSTLTTLSIFSQNFNKLNSKEIIHVSGGLNMNSRFNHNTNSSNYSPPYRWNVSGNLNIQVLDLSLPFEFHFSNSGNRYSQPFNFTSFNPKYKWFQAYIGLTSMNISDYTISGKPFLGAGLELSFKNLQIRGMYGRLHKAIEPLEGVREETYKRIGAALSVEYKIKSTNIQLSFLKAKDEIFSIEKKSINSTIKPKDNFVTDLKLNTTLFKRIKLNINYSNSFITQNLLLPKEKKKSSSKFNLIETNFSTEALHSIKSSLQYQGKIYQVKILYEYTDPNFESLGAYFINNDYDRYHLNNSFRLIKGKLNLIFGIGFQRNNIRNTSKSRNNRIIGNISINSILTKTTNLTISYNNFSTTSFRPINSDSFYNQEFDSLKLIQSNQVASLQLSQKIGSKHKPQNLVILINFNQNSTIQRENHSNTIINTENQPISTNLSSNIQYTINFSKKNSSISASININNNKTNLTNSFLCGPNLSYSKKLFQKTGSIRGSLSYNFNQNKSDQSKLTNHLLCYQINFTAAPKIIQEKYGKFNFLVNLRYLQRLSEKGKLNSQLFNLNLGLNYSIP